MTKGQLEEEGASKNDALRLLSKSVGDSQMWRQKYEKEGLAKKNLFHCISELGKATFT